jgi:uridine kinase
MVLEGVSSSRVEFRPYLTFSIWVETPKNIYMDRGISRDLGSNPDNLTFEQLTDLWNKWHSYEERYAERDMPKDYVDVIVDGTEPHEE